MQIIDVLTAPWAIMPDKLIEIRSIYDAHKRGEKIDIQSVEARIGKPLQNDSQGYQINSGVAVIPVHGVMSKRMNMFMEISGGVSTELIARDVNAALQDPNVNSILLHIDSPGGSVDGVETLGNIIKDAAAIKPVVAFADGTMASAAYWIGSAAQTIVASSSTTHIGSIGVVATHQDISKFEESRGIKTTEISAGRYKRIASQYSPLSEEGQAVIQDQVDQLYTIFVDTVAENRGVSSETVLSDMADGRVFLARDAQSRGMIDYIASLDATIQNMASGLWPIDRRVSTVTKPTQTASADNPAQNTEQPAMATQDPQAGGALDIQTLREKHPDLVTQIESEAAQAECERIKSCEDAMLPGHEKLVASMKFDGKSTGSDVALAIVGAEQKLRKSNHQAFIENAPQVIDAAPITGFADDRDDGNDESASVEDRAKQKWNSDSKLRAEFGEDFKSYLAFEKARDSGKVKILGGTK